MRIRNYVEPGTHIYKAFTTQSGRIANTSRYTATQLLDIDDDIVFCNGTFTIDLPAGIEGTHYRIINAGAGTISVDGNGSEQVRGGATATVLTGEIIDLHYNATEGWW